MGLFVAIKFPLLIGCTLICNALLNGLLGILLGMNLGFRQSFLALLTAFSLAALILGSLAPVTFLIAVNAPPPDAPEARIAHASYLVTHTLLVGFAGIVSNIHLHKILVAKAANRFAATVTLLAWLGGNGFLGAQFSWVLRPFFGSPSLKVQFLRDDPFDGNFYETVWKSIERISGGNGVPMLTAILIAIAASILISICEQPVRLPKP